MTEPLHVPASPIGWYWFAPDRPHGIYDPVYRLLHVTTIFYVRDPEPVLGYFTGCKRVLGPDIDQSLSRKIKPCPVCLDFVFSGEGVLL
ncbi:hypothetical protein GCM10010174_61240 [Kutzneria viridogrisea]|uniref:Uncharacterized protein n=1 Tax=Kutzneria viridogrisea TaxID=47990 RepID=A0ABR6BGE6_9PSEU|nr:hypothetical protein [Kutzneria viridogrisea]